MRTADNVNVEQSIQSIPTLTTLPLVRGVYGISADLRSGMSTLRPPFLTILSWLMSVWRDREGGNEGERERGGEKGEGEKGEGEKGDGEKGDGEKGEGEKGEGREGKEERGR